MKRQFVFAGEKEKIVQDFSSSSVPQSPSQPSVEQWHSQNSSLMQPNSQPVYPSQQVPGYMQPQSSYPQMPPLQQPPMQGYPQQYAQPQMPGYPQQPQPPMQGYPQQQMQPYPAMPMQGVPNVNTIVNINTNHQGPGFLMRAVYFVFIGWWAGYIWLNIGFALCLFIITLPLGLMMLNRVPQVLTLRQPDKKTSVQVATVMTANGVTNMVNVNISGTQQYNILIRALYYLFIGCWAGYIWANIGYALCLTVIGLPVGILMLNRLPMVLTLRKN